MKYIVFGDGQAVVFAETADHKLMAGNQWVRSAGFCRIETYRNQFDDLRAKIVCWGESKSLGMKSNPEEDAKAISQIWFGC